MCGFNPLDSVDFERMRLPFELWRASKAGLSASIHEPITNFVDRIRDVKASNVSLYLHGTKGSGKTGAGVIILKEARSWGFTAYSISVTELREAVRTHEAFDLEGSVMDRCRSVDFLMLDDLRSEDAAEKLFTINDIRNLIVSRHDRGLPTVITSLLGPTQWATLAPMIGDAFEKCCAVQHVSGPNRHQSSIESKNSFLRKPKS